MLALDIATSTGWAMSVKGRVSSGTLNLPTDDYGHMAASFGGWLCDRVFDGVEVFVIERPTFNRITDSSYRCDGLCWTAHHIAWASQIERREVRPSEWRKAVLGKGNYSTAEAKARAIWWCKNNGFNPAGHDEAEALCILSYGMEQWG